MFRRFPGSIDLEIMEIADGRASALATPRSARNMMSSMAVRENPLRRVKTAMKKHPMRQIDREPITSAKDPARRKQEPLARANAEFGQSKMLRSIGRSFAIVGSPIVMIPLLKLVMKPVPASCVITIKERPLERV